MTEANHSEEIITELETEIEALKSALAEHEETSEAKRVIDFAKLKNAISDSAKDVLDTIKPVIEKFEEPSRAAVAKVGNRVSDNPFLSIIIAFGAGIVIGKILDCQCCRKEEE